MEISTALQHTATSEITISSPMLPGFDSVLTPEALNFIKELHDRFNPRRIELLSFRSIKQTQIDNGIMPDFNPETLSIREGEWKVAPTPHDLQDRRVEITGPVDRKMIINALNSSAKVFMADFEDSTSPTWTNIIEGQINLRDAIRGTIDFTHPRTGKYYTLKEETATLMVRPRGWHLEEKNLLYCDQPISASLVDFGLFFFHNAFALIDKGSGPYFYLPKLENHLEARLWNDIFVFAQEKLLIPQQSIKATVLIETILAAFEVDEILFELRDHSAGLNCGRWDYIFSYIKKFKNLPEFIVPDRSQVGMSAPFMNAYSLLVIETCHKRGVHALGGMAAQIPIKNNPKANAVALNKVRKDKIREVQNGHDGTWVAHPALVGVAMEIFDQYMPAPNQIGKRYDYLSLTKEQLLEVPTGTITEEGLRLNVNVGILYLESWLSGNGAAAIYNLMEDAATAEISRSQIWQWIRHGAKLEDGRTINILLFKQILEEELENIKSLKGEEKFQNGAFHRAALLFEQIATNENFEDFLTLPAYQFI